MGLAQPAPRYRPRDRSEGPELVQRAARKPSPAASPVPALATLGADRRSGCEGVTGSAPGAELGRAVRGDVVV